MADDTPAQVTEEAPPVPVADVSSTSDDHGTTPEVTPETGTPPEDRWPDILDNARTKAAEEASAAKAVELEAEYQQRYGWAAGLDRSEAEQALVEARMRKADPYGYLKSEEERLRNHPEHRGRFTPPTDLPKPDIDLQGPDGRLMASRTAENMDRVIQHHVGQVEAKFQGVIAGLEQRIATLSGDFETRQQQSVESRQIDTWIDAARAHPQTGTWFTEHEAAITAAFTTLPDAQVTELGGIVPALQHAAYLVALDPNAKAAQAASSEARARTKAAASTAAPATGPTSPAARPKTQKDLAAFLEQHEKAQAS